MDSSKYEGAYSDATEPGFHLVFRRAENSNPEHEVIRVPSLDVQGAKLVCEYDILADGINDEEAHDLIIGALLTQFCDRYYEDEANELELINIQTQYRRLLPYGE